MLHQADFQYQYADLSALGSDPAVKLHGILMHHISHELAASLHQPKFQPLAIFCRPTDQNCFLARVSALNDEIAPLLDVLKQQKSLHFTGADQPVILCGISQKTPADIRTLPQTLRGNTLHLHFLTAATLLKNGHAFTPPQLELYFMSVLRKIREFEQLDISHDAFCEAFSACSEFAFHLETVPHALSGFFKSGMAGEVSMRLPNDKEQASLLKTVFAYAGYCGVGAKTTQGMGGFLASCECSDSNG